MKILFYFYYFCDSFPCDFVAFGFLLAGKMVGQNRERTIMVEFICIQILAERTGRNELLLEMYSVNITTTTTTIAYYQDH